METTKTTANANAMEKLTAMGFTIELATAEHIENVKTNMSTEKPEIIFCRDYADKDRKDRVYKAWLQAKKDREKIRNAEKAIEDRKAEKTRRPVQTVQTKKAAETVKTAENVKKSTYDIAVEKMTRMQAATKRDNDINRLSRYISDYLNNNGYTATTKNHIATVLTPLAIRIVKNKLYAIQYRKDRTYSIYNDPIMIELFRNYRFEKIDPLTLHFSKLETVDRQAYSFNSDNLKTAEQCTKAAEYTSTTIAADCVNQCILSLLESIENMYSNGKIIDLLSCYIIPYNTTDKNGIEIDPKKWRYKAVNAVNIAGDVIEKVFADYERNKHKSLDDFNALYDRDGYEKTPVISAISDSYGDIEINAEMIDILKVWIDEMNLTKNEKTVAIEKYINGLTVAEIAEKMKRAEKTVEGYITTFRNALREYVNDKNPDKIKSACNKKYIAMYDIYNKLVAKYDSVSAAAKALSVSRTAIQKALAFPRVATCKGYTFDVIYSTTDKTTVTTAAEKTTAAKNEIDDPTLDNPKIFIDPVSIPIPSITKPLPTYITDPAKYYQYCTVINELSAEKNIF